MYYESTIKKTRGHLNERQWFICFLESDLLFFYYLVYLSHEVIASITGCPKSSFLLLHAPKLLIETLFLHKNV